MSKKGLSIVSILILLAGFLFFFKEFSLPRFVSDRLTDMMKVYVSLDDLSLGLKSIEGSGFVITNPKGCKLPHAMTIEEGVVNAPIFSLFKDVVEIDSIQLDGIYVGLEFPNKNSKQGNWTTIMKNLNAYGGKTEPSNKRVKVKKCILTDLKIELAYTSGNPAPKFYPTIARLELYDIDSENGLPLKEISQAILQETLNQIFSEDNIKNMLENMLENRGVPFKLPFLQGQ